MTVEGHRSTEPPDTPSEGHAQRSTDEAGTERHPSKGSLVWLTGRIAHLGLLVVAAFSLVAVPLAMVGWFRWYVLFPLLAVVATVLWATDRSLPFRLRAGTVPTVAVLVAIGVAGILSFLHPTQHFTTNRDPGIYAVTGLWLEREGSILFDGLSPEFAATGGVVAEGAGFYSVRADGRLDPQFAHLTHTVLGAAAMAGGDPLLTRVNVLIGALSMVVLYLLIQQVASGWAAATGTAAIAFALPQLYFTRGPYSEPLAQLLLLGALAVLISDPRLSRGHALLAGLLLGAVLGSRIDAILVVPALVLVLCAWLLERRSLRPLPYILGGAAITGTIGLVDLRNFAGNYLADHAQQFGSALLLTGAMVVVATTILLGRRPLTSFLRRLEPHRDRIAVGAGSLTWAIVLLVLFVRPRFPGYRSDDTGLVVGLQRRQGFDDDPPRSFVEQAPEWLTWYLGWPLVLTAALGAALVVHRLIRRWSWPLFTVVVALGLPTAVYLYQPSITGDHLWVMRRFLPAALPLMAVLAAIGLDRLRAAWAPRGLADRQVVLGLSSVVVIAAMAGSFQYWTFREFRLDTAGLRAMCEVIDGRPVLIEDEGSLGSQFAQPLAAACGVDTARVRPDQDPVDVAVAAGERYQQRGVELVVMSRADDLDADPIGWRWLDSASYRVQEIERSVGRPPIGTEGPAGRLSVVHFYVVGG